jgi:hypothetical protein
MRTPLLVLTSLLAFGLAACSGDTSTAAADSDNPRAEWPPIPSVEQIGEPIGTVDGMPIGEKEFDTMAARQMGRDGTIDADTRTEIVDRLIDEKLLYMEALRQGIDKDPKIQKMMVNTLLKQEVYSQVRTSEISEDDLTAYFEEHKEEFVVPEKVQIKRILIKAEDGGRPLAEEVRAAIVANPADFKSLAQRHSKGPYARRGGDMGFVTADGKPGVDAAVVEAAFALSGTGVSPIFETDDGLNIVYVPNRRERVERTFVQMRGSVLRKVKSDRYRSLYDGYVGGLREGAAIALDQERIDSHQIRSARPLDPDASGLRVPATPGGPGIPVPAGDDGSAPADDGEAPGAH